MRCYDILGVLPKAVICFDTHGPANRVTSKRWPSAELLGDVRQITEEMVDGWFRKTVPLDEVHFWAGFPCTDLSSAKAGRQGLAGEASGLFWEVVRVRKLLQRRAPAHVTVKYVAENVASMDASANTKPLKMDPAEVLLDQCATDTC
jgi:site-specific DNA-cytosine methylase